jgi:hypothetical protein
VLARRGEARRLIRVFRDFDELATGNLPEALKRALEQSRTLVVICSPRAPASAWMAEEVEYFRSLGRDAQIYPVLIEGEPADSFPVPLRDVDRLAADLRAKSLREARRRLRTEKLRLLAPILGYGFDDLRQRHHERYARRLSAVVASLSTLLVVFAVLIWQLAVQRNEANRQTKAAQLAEAKEKEQRIRAEAATKEANAQTPVAENATRQAHAQARVARSRQLAALSEAERGRRLDRSLLLAVTALQIDDTFEARDSLYKALLSRPGLASFLHAPESRPGHVAFSPDGKTLAASVYDEFDGSGGVMLWDTARRIQLVGAPLPVKEGYPTSVAFSADGKTLAAGIAGRPSGVALWDVPSRARLDGGQLAVAEGGVVSAAFSPDGKTLAAGYRQSNMSGEVLASGVALWDVASRARRSGWPLAVTQGLVQSAAFSPDGGSIAVGYAGWLGIGGGVLLGDVSARQWLGGGPLATTEGGVWSVSFHPDGKSLAAGFGRPDGSSSGFLIWDVAEGKARANVSKASASARMARRLPSGTPRSAAGASPCGTRPRASPLVTRSG